ncbi:UPF0052-domain-containing protein [Auriculariales sp. MPI-PUGE-AT-0066]|nr:UPF0052-domain-containing protein [Auriculariales sp. MPI-PUGE-AT-0066]
MAQASAVQPSPSMSTLYTLPPSATSSVFDLPVHRGTQRPTPIASTPKGTISLSGDNPFESEDAPRVLVLSGGTGCNAICAAFGPNASYVLPVSDNGGSSAEIIRVLGGPSIGDIRSRLVRLIPDAPRDSPLIAIRALLAYRIPPELSDEDSKREWRDIVEGVSPLWRGIPGDRKETIRGFLVYFENELLKRADKNFSFRNGSIGNYWLAGAQHFFRSLPSAIFLFSSITTSQASILPVIVTNHTVTIAAQLDNNATLVGQCEISHPVAPPPLATPELSLHAEDGTALEAEPDGADIIDGIETSDVSTRNVTFSKGDQEEAALPAPISRLFYINAYGQETHPRPNPTYLRSCADSELLVYSCGSLWTSIVPCLALRGVGKAIAGSRSLRAKVLLLNSKNDRETPNYRAVDYLSAIVRTLNTSDPNAHSERPASAFVTHLVYLLDGTVPVDVGAIENLGISCLGLAARKHDKDGVGKFDKEVVMDALTQISAF